MWSKLFRRFVKETIDTEIRWYESYLQGHIGQLRIDHSSGLERYKQSEHPHPAVLKAWSVHLKRRNFSQEGLKEAKKKLGKGQYYSLLQTLMWHYLEEDKRFMLWRDLCAHEPVQIAYTFWEFAMGGAFFDSALRSPYGAQHELPERIPEALYMHHRIMEYPKVDLRDVLSDKVFSEKKFAKMEKVTRDLAQKDGPWFWGRLDGIYAIRYHAGEAICPRTGSLTTLKIITKIIIGSHWNLT